jgi:stage IV sporulation protein B
MYLIGAWVRDSCAGIGTVTYYDTDNHFAALGHGICDSDTSVLMPLSSGEVVKASISGVTKSTSGKAGSLNGYFTDNKIGTLTKNTAIGIYGTTEDYYSVTENKIEVAQADEVKTGSATMYTTINNSEVCSYDIEITRICNKKADSNENFVIRIKDDNLINSCGGIVQGMSGSPIVQNGKLVGAVTHVFLNRPEEGFGVLAQNMVANFEE